jgi:hypothetical protein
MKSVESRDGRQPEKTCHHDAEEEQSVRRRLIDVQR